MNEVYQILREKEGLKKYDGEYKVVLSKEIKEKLEKEKNIFPNFAYKTKIPKLDKILGDGIEEGQLIVISGSTGIGKSSFMTSLTFNFAEQNIKALWLSYELTYRQLFEKLDWTGLPLPDFYLPIKIRHQSMEWLRERIVESVVKYDVKIVFIDHLHSLLPFNCIDPTKEVSNRVRLLKALAIEFNIIIICAVKVKRDLMEIIPTEHDLRDSAMIGDEADTVIFIWRKLEKQTKEEKLNEGLKYRGNESVLYVAKCRKTGTRDFVPLIYENNIFKELTYDTGEFEQSNEGGEKENEKIDTERMSF